MRIGLDVSGGDFAPEANLAGALLAFAELPQDVRIFLIGDEIVISNWLDEKKYSKLKF